MASKDNKEKDDIARTAKLLQGLEELLGDDGVKGMTERLKQLETLVGPMKNIDLKAVFEQVERNKAGQAELAKSIKRSKGGLYVSGIEDVKDFSIARAMLGRRIGFKEAGAQQEYEIMKAATEKAREMYSKAGISISDDRSAGSFIPDQVIPDVISGIYTRSVFINLDGEGDTRVSVLEGLTGGNVTIPKFDGGLIAYWIGEEDEYAESLVNTDVVTLNPKKLGILVKITEEMRKLSGFGFENLLRKDMIRAAAKKLDYTILYGSGTLKAPRGILNTPGIKIYSAQSKKFGVLGVDALGGAQFQADWQGADLDFDGLDNMSLALEEDDIDLDDVGSPIISSPRFFRRLKQLKVTNFSGQTTQQPYLIGLPMIPNSRLAEIIGPFDRTTQIKPQKPGASIGAPTTSSNVKYNDVVHGDLTNYVLGRWAGIEIEDDAGKGKGFTSDAIYMKLRMLADGAMRQPRSIVACTDAKIID